MVFSRETNYCFNMKAPKTWFLNSFAMLEKLWPWCAFERFGVILTYCAHPPIPKHKIQPIVTFKILVVEIMAYRSVYPFSQ